MTTVRFGRTSILAVILSLGSPGGVAPVSGADQPDVLSEDVTRRLVEATLARAKREGHYSSLAKPSDCRVSPGIVENFDGDERKETLISVKCGEGGADESFGALLLISQTGERAVERIVDFGPHYEIIAVTDLDGDGLWELYAGLVGFEMAGHSFYRFQKGELVQLGVSGCL